MRITVIILMTLAGSALLRARTDHVESIHLPQFVPNLPPGPGREAFAGACLSCHSTRYVTIQPPMTAAKWEENVRKMIKTYAAPITDQQVPLIVQYLMATKESGSAKDWDPLVSPPRSVGPATPVESSGDVRHGAEVFAKACASCHGPGGAGNGFAAATQLPRPTDLTSGRFATAALSGSIQQGVAGTAMPSFPTLSRSDLQAVIAYTDRLQPSATAAPAHFEDAKSLYTKNCANCHGPDGAGDGIAAAPLARTPTNFRLRQPSADHAFKVLSDGIAGTAMAGWKTKLSEAQRKMLADYIRGFYSEPRGD